MWLSNLADLFDEVLTFTITNTLKFIHLHNVHWGEPYVGKLDLSYKL